MRTYSSSESGSTVSFAGKAVYLLNVFHKKQGVLLIIWGWFMCYTFLKAFLVGSFLVSFSTKLALDYIGYGLTFLTVIFMLLYLFQQRRALVGVNRSVLLVWVSLIAAMVLVNLIQYNVLQEIKFELQHPIFMVLTAFSIVVTGRLLRYQLMIFGGIIFAGLAYFSSYLHLTDQLLAEAVGWFVAFVVPGHLRFLKK